MRTLRRRPVIKPCRPAAHLRIDTFEDRVVPTLAVGVNVDSFGLTGGAPDGNSLAVGPSHVVQFLAGDVEVLDKTGNFLLSEADTAFWTAAGISSSLFSVGLSQPRVVYDALANRWFATEFSLALTDNEIFVARSDTSDPTGHWTAVHYAGAAGLYTQYTTLGVDANGVYVGAADLNPGDPLFGLPPTAAGSSLSAIPKSDLLAATPTAANRTTFTQLANNPPGSVVTMGWAPQVVTNFDPNPTHASVVATDYDVFHTIDVTPITWSGGVPTLGTTVQVATSLNNSLPGNSRQPGSRIIDGGTDDRYMGAVYQVGDLIYAAHTLSVNSSGASTTSGTGTHNAIHVVVVRASTNTLVAEKIYFNNNFDYSFASVAANANGDIVMGVNRSGSSTTNGQLGAYVVHGRLDLTTPGLLPTQRISFDQELEVFPGQTGTGGFNLGDNPEAWGPYGATVLDPTNPNVFWTTQEYAASTDTWGTRVAAVGVAPQALNVSSTVSSGVYGVGAVIPITVAFDAAVAVTGTPTLHLNLGADAVYTGGSGTSTLTFTYTVAAGQTTSGGRLDYTSTTPFGLTGATITDAASGIAATLTLPAPGTAGSLSGTFNIVIDTAVPPAPAVTGVNSSAPDGTYGAGADIPIQVTFNRPVHVTGVPQLALNTGVAAGYVSGDGTATLVFNYHVGAGEHTAHLDYLSAAALIGGTITDQANGSAANTTLPVPGAVGSLGANRNIVIDAVAATVLNVTSTQADGRYGAGTVIDVTVRFDHPVTVAGTPQLALNTGGLATYQSGSGTDTLTFRYTVAAGENTPDLDYAGTNALTVNGGSIQAGGQNASLTLPAPGGPGSLGFNKNLAIDTSAPTVVDFQVLYGTKAYSLFGSTRYDLPWQITGVRVVFSDSIYFGNAHSLTGRTATRLTGLKTTTLTWRFPGVSRGSFNTGLVTTGTNALKDRAGNAVAAFSQAFNVLWGDVNDDHFVNALDEAAVRGQLTGPFQPGTAGTNPFADLSGDGLVNLIDVGVTRTRRGTFL